MKWFSKQQDQDTYDIESFRKKNPQFRDWIALNKEGDLVTFMESPGNSGKQITVNIRSDYCNCGFFLTCKPCILKNQEETKVRMEKAKADFLKLQNDICKVCPHCNTDDCESDPDEKVYFWCNSCGTLITPEWTLIPYQQRDE